MFSSISISIVCAFLVCWYKIIFISVLLNHNLILLIGFFQILFLFINAINLSCASNFTYYNFTCFMLDSIVLIFLRFVLLVFYIGCLLFLFFYANFKSNQFIMFICDCIHPVYANFFLFQFFCINFIIFFRFYYRMIISIFLCFYRSLLILVLIFIIFHSVFNVFICDIIAKRRLLLIYFISTIFMTNFRSHQFT